VLHTQSRATAWLGHATRFEKLGCAGEEWKNDGDSEHYLYPQEQPMQGYNGYRDAILGEEGAVLGQN